MENLDEYTVEYRVHVQDIGWTEWYIDGESAGTTGRNLKIEAIEIRIVPHYKRYYIGVDVSKWQNKIDYNKVVASKKIDFMIARIGWYSEDQKKFIEDDQFKRNYKETKNKKIPLGAYIYSYTMKSAGYEVGVYSYSYWLANYLDINKLPEDYNIWIADYGESNGQLPDDIFKYSKGYDMWQYTDKGKIDGITGNIDLNICYKRYF